MYLVGHSRGGKLSVLAAARDPRITACCLLDPVDNTKYAPLGPEFPSAVAALRQLSMQVGLHSSAESTGAVQGAPPRSMGDDQTVDCTACMPAEITLPACAAAFRAPI